LATDTIVGTSDMHESLIDGFPGWLKTLIVFSAIGSVYFLGKFVIEPILHYVAKTRLQELFTASALLLVIGVSYLMQLVGLSPALGAFLAGVVLANSEFKHELEGDIAPFKGLLLGLFFIGVGASINFELIFEQPIFILAFVLLLTAVKFFVLIGIGKIYKKSSDQNLLFSFGLSQAGEFGFVIMSFCLQLSIVDQIIASQIMAIIALSMLLTPFLLLFNDRYIDPYFGVKKVEKPPVEEIEEKNEVIIAGFGHFGSTIGRLLRANGVNATILDHDSDRVDLLRKMGFKVYYGDATRIALLNAASIGNAKLFIAAIDNPTVNLTMIENIRKHYPDLKILSRARNRIDAFELIDHGVTQYYRETLYTAVHMGVDALVALGERKYSATRQGQRFIKYDAETTTRLAAKRHDKMAFLATMQDEIELQEELLRNDAFTKLNESDHAWDSEALKKSATENS
jgi:CPA2 family monovalent cation:H+ antiporter-2